jgi:hypothetical protein
MACIALRSVARDCALLLRVMIALRTCNNGKDCTFCVLLVKNRFAQGTYANGRDCTL